MVTSVPNEPMTVNAKSNTPTDVNVWINTFIQDTVTGEKTGTWFKFDPRGDTRFCPAEANPDPTADWATITRTGPDTWVIDNLDADGE